MSKQSFLRFGRYEGIWKNEETGFECELVIDENNFKAHHNIKEHPYSFDGYLEWRSSAIPENFGKLGLGKIAMEKVRGFYFNGSGDENNHKLICMGYEVYQSVDPKSSGTSYTCDGYKFDLNPKYKSIESFACSNGKWNTPICIKRVASKDELIEILMDSLLNERGIVGIISNMLHAFTVPNISLQSENINEYKLEIRILLSYQNPLIKPLFDDIFDFEQESTVKIIGKSDVVMRGGLEIEIGEECTVIYRTDSGFYMYAIYNDGKENNVKAGWLQRQHVQEVM